MTRALRETEAIFRRADAAYRPFSCPASAECCQLTQVKRQPWLWTTEWQLLERAVLARRGRLPPPRPDGGCPFLDAEGRRCTVYDVRPLGCRTFFCHRVRGPAREPAEVMNELSLRLERVNQQVDPDTPAPRPLLELFEAARAGR